MKLLLKQLTLFAFIAACVTNTSLVYAATELTIIGSGACLPMPHRRHPGNLLRVNDQRFLVDSGPGTIHSLAMLGVQPDQLSGAFYTHFHHDHVGDLASIIGWFQAVIWHDHFIRLNKEIHD